MKREPFSYGSQVGAISSSPAKVELMTIAVAIANARARRRGILPTKNVLDRLKPFGGGVLYAEVLEDAAAALHAVRQARGDVGPELEATTAAVC